MSSHSPFLIFLLFFGLILLESLVLRKSIWYKKIGLPIYQKSFSAINLYSIREVIDKIKAAIPPGEISEVRLAQVSDTEVAFDLVLHHSEGILQRNHRSRFYSGFIRIDPYTSKMTVVGIQPLIQILIVPFFIYWMTQIKGDGSPFWLIIQFIVIPVGIFAYMYWDASRKYNLLVGKLKELYSGLRA